MNQKLVIGNLKMNLLSIFEREEYLKNFRKELIGKKFSQTEIILCPPFIHLERFVKIFGKKVSVGAQDCFWENSGSYTGEISPAMLKNFSCSYVILGHSERRKYLGENNEAINQKVLTSLKNNLLPIICVGETKAERQEGETMRVITEQIQGAFQSISEIDLGKIVVAYEPIWSVGTNEIPTANEILEAKVLIQKILSQMFSKQSIEKVTIIYGGSVSVKTVKETCIDGGMSGALIGRESLTPREFIKIAQIINNY